MPYGFAGSLGIAKETTWGTPVAPSTDYLMALSESLKLEIDRFETTAITGGRYYESDDEDGLRKVSGDIVFPVHPNIISALLRSNFGVMSGSVVLSGFLWKQTFTPVAAEFSTDCPCPPYTIEVHRDVTSAFIYAGCIVNKLAFAVQPNQEWRGTASIIGKSVAVGSRTTATFPSSPVSPFTWDQTSVEIGGAATSLAEAMNITLIDNQVEGIPVLNASTNIARMRRKGPQLVRVSGTFDFSNLTEYNNFVNQTEQALRVTALSPSSFSIVIQIPRLVYTSYPVAIGGKERLTVAFEGMGRYHTGSGLAIQVDVTCVKSNF